MEVSGVVVLLFFKESDNAVLKSYRSISLLKNVYKLFARVNKVKNNKFPDLTSHTRFDLNRGCYFTVPDRYLHGDAEVSVQNCSSLH